jgi:16S rRNA (cytidine1402-2'-O)-methyltransferase
MLTLVATPIGEVQEITLTALETLRSCDVVICESTKEASKLLKAHGISGKKYELLSEHTTPVELNQLAQLCLTQHCALVTDCGTPGFSDPGADLVRLCRRQGVQVRSNLGASALMGLLSLSSQKLTEFYFKGFLPANNEERKKALSVLKNEKRALIIMDTPYRLKKTIEELALCFPKRKALLVLNLSQVDEEHLECELEQMPSKLPFEKAEFMLLIYSCHYE